MNDRPSEPNNPKGPGDGIGMTSAHSQAHGPRQPVAPPPPGAPPGSGPAGAGAAQPPRMPPPEMIEENRKQLNRLLEEIGRLTETDVPPAEFFGEFLKRMRQAMNAKGGAVWCRTPQGNLQLQFQIEMQSTGIHQSDESRHSHDELLRQAMLLGKPVHLPPRSSFGTAPGQGAAPGNPTEFILLIVPILLDKQTVGLVEIWQFADRHPSTIPGFQAFMAHLSDLAARYLRNQTTNQLARQQALWGQLEGFSRQIHGSLKPIEVAYSIANEARRIIECDRVSVAVRYGKRCKVEAISGADQVETRSNLVKLMRALSDSVIQWREKLIFTGAKDESLPPKVHAALDAYLEESNSRLLVLMPLQDEREKDSHRPPRSALLMECFEPQTAPEQLIARLEVVGKHCAPALYNAVEHRRIPFRFIWVPLAKVQEGLGGKAKAITLLVTVGLLLAIIAFFIIPYPLKVEGTGELQPLVWANVYTPAEARIERFLVTDPRLAAPDEADRTYPENHEAFLIHAPKIGQEIIELQAEVAGLANRARQAQFNFDSAVGSEKASARIELDARQQELKNKQARLEGLKKDFHADPKSPDNYFVLLPEFTGGMRGSIYQWSILNTGFDSLRGKDVKPSEPVLRVGYIKQAPGTDEKPQWQIELKIPQKHIGQVLKGFKPKPRKDKDAEQTDKDEEEPLIVDLLVKSHPTEMFKGKLYRSKIAGEARPQQNDNNESEPVVYAYVQIHDLGKGFNPDDEIPEFLLKTGTEVHAKIRCGDHRLGYSLFYGLWEFFYEKVVFFF